MSLKDGYSYAVFLLAVLVVTLPHYLFGFTVHHYLDVSLSPLHGTIRWFSTTARSLGRWTLSREKILDRFTRLQRKNRTLRRRNKSLRLVARRYERLRGEVGLPSDSPPLRPVAANVTRSHLTAWERTVLINRGSPSGLRKGDPVLNVVGDTWVLYGQVLEVFSRRSRVITTSDPRFKIGVVVEGIPGRQFVVRGTGRGELSIPHFPRVLNVPGDASVRTAPASSIAPRGLLVGSVNRTARARIQAGTGKKLLVKPVTSGTIPSVLWVLIDR